MHELIEAEVLVDDGGVKVTTEPDAIPDRRVKNKGMAQALCDQLINDDIIAAQDRMNINLAQDGQPPFDQCALDEDGQSERLNISTKDSSARESAALGAYRDLESSLERLFTGDVEYGDVTERPVWAYKIAFRISKMLREWTSWDFNIANCQTQFVRHGIGVAYHQDDVNWKFKTTGLENFKIRRSTDANEDAIDIAMIQETYTVQELCMKLKDRKVSESIGWDIKELESLILANINNTLQANNQPPYQNFERFERQVKEKDIFLGGGDYHVYVNNLFVKEFNGAVTHIMVPQTGSKDGVGGQTVTGKFTIESITNDEGGFLFEKRCKYGNIHQCLTAFTFGIGDGTYHTIRGLGWNIYPQEMAAARMINTMLDGAQSSNATMLQPMKGTQLDNMRMALSINGPFVLLPGGLTVVNRTLPDATKTALPYLAILDRMLDNNTKEYAQVPSASSAADIPVANYAALGASELRLKDQYTTYWYRPFGRLLKELVRRITRREYCDGEPGYEEVLQLKKDLKKDGVPMEAFYSFCNVEPIRSIGAGSAAARLAKYDMAIAQSQDEEGRYNLIRDKQMELLGPTQVDRYFKPWHELGISTSQESQNAQFENNIMGFAKPVNPPSSSASQFLHLVEHTKLLDQTLTPVARGGDVPLEQLEPALAVLAVLLPHMGQHIQYMSTDPSRAAETKQFTQILQQATAEAQRIQNSITRIVNAQQMEMEAEQKRQMDAFAKHVAELEEKAGKDGEDPKEAAKIQRDLISHQIRMKMQEDEFKQKLSQKDAESKQKLAFKDMDQAMKLLELSGINPYTQQPQ